MTWAAIFGGIAAVAIIATSVALYCTGVGAPAGHALLIGGVALGAAILGGIGVYAYNKLQQKKAYDLEALDKQMA